MMGFNLHESANIKSVRRKAAAGYKVNGAKERRYHHRYLCWHRGIAAGDCSEVRR
jgi:hypothetical protein